MLRYQHRYSWPLFPHLTVVHCFQHILRATSRIGTELLYVGSSWTLCLCSSIWRGPPEYITYVLVSTSPAVSCVSGSTNLIVYMMVGVRIVAALWGAVIRTRSILLAAFSCNFLKAFSPPVYLASMWCIHIAVSTRSLLGRNCASSYRSGLTSIWPKTCR